MVEPIGTAVSVLGLAEIGFKLVQSIYTYTNSVRKAEQQLRPIAEYVQVTSTAFEHIAAHLRDEQITDLFKPALLQAIDNALKGCEAAFSRLSTYVDRITNDNIDQSRGYTTTRTKMTWFWKQKELENHQVRLEHCKSTVNVLLTTLTFISASRSAKNTSDVKLELHRLVKLDVEAKKKEALYDYANEDSQFVSQPDVAEHRSDVEDRLPSGVEELIEDRTVEQYEATAAVDKITAPAGYSETSSVSSASLSRRDGPLGEVGGFPILGIGLANPAISSRAPEILSEHPKLQDVLLDHLRECAVATDKLSVTLKQAIEERQIKDTFDSELLLADLGNLDSVVARIRKHEILAEEGSGKSLDGKIVNRQGLVIDEDGLALGIVVDGFAPGLAGCHCDKDGNVYRKVGRAERIPAFSEIANADEAAAPFEGYQGLRMVRDGQVFDDMGRSVGRLVEGNIKHVVGLTVDADGSIKDRQGAVQGYAENTERPLYYADEWYDFGRRRSRTRGRLGNRRSDRGPVFGSPLGPPSPAGLARPSVNVYNNLYQDIPPPPNPPPRPPARNYGDEVVDRIEDLELDRHRSRSRGRSDFYDWERRRRSEERRMRDNFELERIKGEQDDKDKKGYNKSFEDWGQRIQAEEDRIKADNDVDELLKMWTFIEV